MAATAYGFIGLGNMGAAMCAHLCAAGLPITAFDRAGTRERAPQGGGASQPAHADVGELAHLGPPGTTTVRGPAVSRPAPRA